MKEIQNIVQKSNELENRIKEKFTEMENLLNGRSRVEKAPEKSLRQ